jgi:hypothetical protein
VADNKAIMQRFYDDVAGRLELIDELLTEGFVEREELMEQLGALPGAG